MLVDTKQIVELYKEIETTRLRTYSILGLLELGYGEEQELSQYKEFMDNYVQVEESDKHIKVTVKDVLPRSVGLSHKALKEHWFSIMHYAFSKTNKRFNKTMCVIKICHPGVYWDVDNRAYQIIINSLRYNNIVPNDQYAHVSFMVTGETDRKNPRTEIYLLEHPEDPVQLMLQNS